MRYTLDKNKKLFTGRDLDWFERDSKIGPLFPTCEDLGVPTITGRLGSSIEGGGKRNSRSLQLKGSSSSLIYLRFDIRSNKLPVCALRDERKKRAATEQLLTSNIAPLIQLLIQDFV